MTTPPAPQPAPAPQPVAPAAATSGDDFDNLFDEPSGDTPAPPATPADKKPAATDEFEDLLNDDEPTSSSAPPASTEDAIADDSPNSVIEEMAADEPDSVPANEIDPADASAPPAPAEDEFDFGDEVSLRELEPNSVAVAKEISPAAESEAAPSAVGEMRLWTDNTGKFQVVARLVVVLNGQARLQKESGRFTTVRLDRLSRADLAFVQSQVRTIASAGPASPASGL